VKLARFRRHFAGADLGHPFQHEAEVSRNHHHKHRRIDEYRRRRKPHGGDPDSCHRYQGNHEQVSEVPPDQLRRRLVSETQKMVMVHPDDRNKQIADRIA
jgi:hypothetical protein